MKNKKWICVEVNGVFYESINHAKRKIGHAHTTIRRRCFSNKWVNYKIVPFRITYTEKKCTQCGEIKLLKKFHRQAASKDGFAFECKRCKYKRGKEFHKANPGYYKKYEEEHKEEKKQYDKQYNIDYLKRQDVRDRKKERERERRKNDTVFRINRNISSAICRSLKGGKGGKHWEGLVGWTVEEGRAHLESLFTEGMNWDNYGKGGWVIDHIKAVAKFNIISNTCQEFKDCWALNNLQPLWKIRNAEKKDRPMHPKYLIKPF